MRDDIECAFIGRLTADPVQRTGSSGKPWLSFTLAVGSGDGAQFVSVALFGDAARELQARKGDRLYVEGRITLRTWTDKEGHERAGLSVASFHAMPVGQIGQRRPPKSKAGNDQGDDAEARRDWQRPPSSETKQGSMFTDDQIPF